MADEVSLTSATDATGDDSTDSMLVEGKDYYWEGPFMVFTAHYLLRRGYCCERNCRHCPYAADSDLREKYG